MRRCTRSGTGAKQPTIEQPISRRILDSNHGTRNINNNYFTIDDPEFSIDNSLSDDYKHRADSFDALVDATLISQRRESWEG